MLIFVRSMNRGSILLKYSVVATCLFCKRQQIFFQSSNIAIWVFLSGRTSQTCFPEKEKLPTPLLHLHRCIINEWSLHGSPKTCGKLLFGNVKGEEGKRYRRTGEEGNPRERNERPRLEREPESEDVTDRAVQSRHRYRRGAQTVTVRSKTRDRRRKHSVERLARGKLFVNFKP